MNQGDPKVCFQISMYPIVIIRESPPSTNVTRLLWIDFSLHPRSQFSFIIFCGQDNIIRGKASRDHEQALLPNLFTSTTSLFLPICHLSSANAISMPHSAIPCHRAPLEECLPFISQNTFSVHSPCSYFDIDATHPVHPTPSRLWQYQWNM